MQFLSQEIYERVKSNSSLPFCLRGVFDYKDILSWKDINNYLNNIFNYIPDQISIIDNDGFTKSFNFLKIPYDQIYRFPIDQVVDGINSGNSFIIHNFTRFNEKINSIASEIENNFYNFDLDFHIYAGLTKNSRSFSIHRDASFNFIFQLDGKSHWKVYNKDDTIPYSSFDSDEGLELIIDKVLNPGDLLYIPLGNYHKCIPLGKRISISSCFSPETKGMDKRPQKWYNLSY